MRRVIRRVVRFLVEHRRPVLAVLLCTAAGLVLLLFVIGGDDEDDPLGGRAGEVVAVMEDFERAAQRGDFGRICNQLFTTEAREAAGGDDCPSLLAQSAEGVSDIQVELESIVVRGNFASARISASADGVQAATDTVRFTRRGGRFQIASLSP
jgi:hypothetical protein